jgi:hypothetical protein
VLVRHIRNTLLLPEGFSIHCFYTSLGSITFRSTFPCFLPSISPSSSDQMSCESMYYTIKVRALTLQLE